MADPRATSAKPFENFDDSDVFEKFKRLARSHKTRNFVIDFNENQALCAFDLDKHDFEDALSKRSAENNEVRTTRCQATRSNISRGNHQRLHAGCECSVDSIVSSRI